MLHPRYTINYIAKACKFSAAFGIDKKQQEDGAIDLVKCESESAAERVGLAIAKRKAWRTWEEDSQTTLYRLDLFVFTPEELEEYVNAVIAASKEPV